MNTEVGGAEAAARLVAQYLCRYHKIWQSHFPGLNKRAHWHVMFSARCSPQEGVSCRSIHRTLYGLYGTDIRTCIERIRDCENDGFIRSWTLRVSLAPPPPHVLSPPPINCTKRSTGTAARRSKSFAKSSQTAKTCARRGSIVITPLFPQFSAFSILMIRNGGKPASWWSDRRD